MNKWILITVAAAATAAVAPAKAEMAVGRAATAVPTGDLNLASPAGVKALDRRIFRAASELCGTPSAADPRGVRAAEACVVEAVAEARSARQQAIAAARTARPVLAVNR